MWKIRMAFSFVWHWFSSSNPRRLHSPALLQLMTDAYASGRQFPDIEEIRRTCLRDNSPLKGHDPGAGSSLRGATTISFIARHSLSSPARLAFLHGLVKAAGFSRVLELGTSLGISAACIDRALPPGGRLITIEGNAAIADIALNNLKLCSAERTELVIADFRDALDKALKMKPEFLIIDGNHRMEPTIAYFRAAVSADPAPQMILIDDIRWSQEMLRAWQTVISHSQVSVSLDFFRFGLVLTSNDFARQHLKIRSLL